MKVQMGDETYVVHEVGGEPYIEFVRICRPFRLNADTEWQRVSRDPAINTKVIDVVDVRGTYKVAALWVNHLPAWLMLYASRDKLPADLRPRYDDMRNLCVRIITDFHTKGVAVNERLIGPEKAREIEAIANQAIAARLSEERKILELARGECRGDAVLAASYAIGLRKLVEFVANGAGGSDDDRPVGVEQIASEFAGVRLSEPEAIRFGALAAKEFRRRYPGEEPVTAAMLLERGLPAPTVTTRSGKSVFTKYYFRRDWGWIADLARRFRAGKIS